MKIHNDGPVCRGCLTLLESVHLEMGKFFIWAKNLYPDLHIAQGWRGEKEQDKAYEDGKSKLKWPNSKHNHMVNFHPCSLALDLFQIDHNGLAKFDVNFYQELYNECVSADLPIRWGGMFKHLVDTDHFELMEKI